jgi:hypothetical protein
VAHYCLQEFVDEYLGVLVEVENIVGLGPLHVMWNWNDDIFHVMWNWVGVVVKVVNS